MAIHRTEVDRRAAVVVLAVHACVRSQQRLHCVSMTVLSSLAQARLETQPRRLDEGHEWATCGRNQKEGRGPRAGSGLLILLVKFRFPCPVRHVSRLGPSVRSF